MNATQKYQALVITGREQEAAAAQHQEAVQAFVGRRLRHLQDVGQVVSVKCYGRSWAGLADEELPEHFWVFYTIRSIELGTQDVTLSLVPSRFFRPQGKEQQVKLPLATLSLGTWAWAKEIRKSIRERKSEVREATQAQDRKKVAELQATLKATQAELARIEDAETRSARKAAARAVYAAAQEKAEAAS